jgi:hypothetical protein
VTEQTLKAFGEWICLAENGRVPAYWAPAYWALLAFEAGWMPRDSVKL